MYSGSDKIKFIGSMARKIPTHIDTGSHTNCACELQKQTKESPEVSSIIIYSDHTW